MDLFFRYLPLANALICAGIGVYVLSRNRKAAANLAFFLGMASLGAMEFSAYVGWPVRHGSYPFLYDKVFGAGEALQPAFWFFFSLAFARADAAGMLKRWRPALVLVFPLSGLLAFLLATDSTLPERVTSRAIGFWVSAFALIVLTFTLAGFENTLRSTESSQRWKIKFLLLGIGSILVFQIYAHSQYLLFPNLDQDFSATWSSVLFLSCLLIVYSLVRHQLLDVDVFVSRHFVYHSFTVAAVGAYLLLVGLAAQAIRSFGGIPASYLKYLFVFLTVLFLLVALLSHRIRVRVKTFIERNFYRHRYDYHKEWLELTERLSSKLEVAELLPAIAGTFLQLLWIGTTRLWLYDDPEKALKEVAPPEEGVLPVRWPPAFLEALKDRDYPYDFDAGEEQAGEISLDGDVKESLRKKGVRILSPLVVGSRFVGVLGLSGTHSSYPLDREDFDLIRTVSKQAAGALLNARLSGNLVRAKEMETFHAFSAFVLHDLKNFVSMLSLVVHNAKDNLDDPEFRADAMQSISQTVEKMKRMMDRLAVFSKEPAVRRVPSDFNGVVREALAEMNGALQSRVAERLGDLPAIAVDPEQMRKVVTNLVLNAQEAMGGKGEIRLSTAGADGKVVLTVSDDGPGMSPEFLRDRLFKPFSTTKSGGFGIGLYQVKGIVEAHGGTIEVASGAGEGTTFRVLLPGEKT